MKALLIFILIAAPAIALSTDWSHLTCKTDEPGVSHYGVTFDKNQNEPVTLTQKNVDGTSKIILGQSSVFGEPIQFKSDCTWEYVGTSPGFLYAFECNERIPYGQLQITFDEDNGLWTETGDDYKELKFNECKIVE